MFSVMEEKHVCERTWLRRLATIVLICCLTTLIAADSATAAAADVDSSRSGGYHIRIQGPAQVVHGEDILITITGSGLATSGHVETEGLEVISGDGGLSTATQLVVMENLGGLIASYRCRVTAPAGSACTFVLRDVVVSDPDYEQDVLVSPTGWSAAVVHDIADAASVSDPETDGPDESWTPVWTVPESWEDALLQIAAASPLIYWDEVCGAYTDVPREIYSGNAYIGQSRTWADYGQFMFDNSCVVVPYLSDGEIIDADVQLTAHQATGQHMYITTADTNDMIALQDVIMLGDVTGSGTLGVSQLVRLAQAVTGRDPLTGLYASAGDLSGNGRIDLSDLAALAGWLKGRFLEL